MNQLQNKLFEMLSWLVNFIDTNGLRYYLVGGTFLGAVRHNGFIPWDDDIDIALPRYDYEKLLKLLDHQIEHYIIESPKSDAEDYVYTYAKFYDTNTSMTELLHKNIKRGVFIDIFPLDGIGEELKRSYNNYKKIDRLNILLAMKVSTYRKERKWWKNIAVLIGCVFPVNTKKLTRQIDVLAAKFDFDNSNYVANCMSTYRSREIIDKKMLGKPAHYVFEGLKVKGPVMADEYLTHIYGDWRKLPPEEKRHSAHNFIDLDFNKPYINN